MYAGEKPRKYPSFSSTLLDQIYESIDESAEGFKCCREKQGSRRYCRKDEEIANFRRSSLVENWIQDSSSSASSDSSGALSSSDTDFFGSSKVSCLPSVNARLKPVRTGGRSKRQGDDTESDSLNSKSRALQIYASFKRAKEPISPGGKLTSFLNSLFNGSSNEKRSKSLDADKSLSAAPFSRSRLTKCQPQPKEKPRTGIQMFNPMVAVEEDYGQHIIKANTLTELKLNGRSSHGRRCDDYDEDDGISDSSSDLFELDHLSLFGSNRSCEELPVYETTHLNAIRAMYQ